jgi:hypothetical protein
VRGRVSVTATLLLAVLAGFFTHSHARREAHVATAHSTHGMMIDAGSDGSRIHVFSWDAVSPLYVYVDVYDCFISCVCID